MKLKKDLLEEIMNMKQRQYIPPIYFIGNYEHETNDKGKIWFGISSSDEVGELLEDYRSEIIKISLSLGWLCESYIQRKMEETNQEEVTLGTIGIYYSTNLGIVVGYDDTTSSICIDKSMEKVLHDINKEISVVCAKIEAEIKNELLEYEDYKNNADFRKYVLLYAKDDNGVMHYVDFVRQGDSEIREQKERIEEMFFEGLLNRFAEELTGFASKLESEMGIEASFYCVSFESDGKTALWVKHGYYPARETPCSKL